MVPLLYNELINYIKKNKNKINYNRNLNILLRQHLTADGIVCILGPQYHSIYGVYWL